MTELDAFFDAFAEAFLREDGVVAGAFDEPTIVIRPHRSIPCPTHAHVARWLADERGRLAALGVDELAWTALEARPVGAEQLVVTVRWNHEDADTIYALRGALSDARITAVVMPS